MSCSVCGNSDVEVGSTSCRCGGSLKVNTLKASNPDETKTNPTGGSKPSLPDDSGSDPTEERADEAPANTAIPFYKKRGFRAVALLALLVTVAVVAKSKRGNVKASEPSARVSPPAYRASVNRMLSTAVPLTMWRQLGSMRRAQRHPTAMILSATTQVRNSERVRGLCQRLRSSRIWDR